MTIAHRIDPAELAARNAYPRLFALADDLLEKHFPPPPERNTEMSSWDLFEDGFPHGTADGYRKGCRGGACPAGVEHGLACRVAFQKAAGDYQYGRLVAAGNTPAQIATIEEEPIMNATAPTATVDKPAVTVAKPTPATVAAAAKKPRKSPEGPSQSDVREWAHANGVDVNARGAVRRDVVAQYLAAQAGEHGPKLELHVGEQGPAIQPPALTEPVEHELAAIEEALATGADIVSEAEDVLEQEAVIVEDPAAYLTATIEPYASASISDEIAEQLAQFNAHIEHLRDERDEARHALTFTLQQWNTERTAAALANIQLREARAAERLLLDALEQAEDDLIASRGLADHYHREAILAEARATRPWWKRSTPA